MTSSVSHGRGGWGISVDYVTRIDYVRYFSFNIGKVYICFIHPCAVPLVLLFQLLDTKRMHKGYVFDIYRISHEHSVFLSCGIFPVDSIAPSKNRKLIELDFETSRLIIVKGFLKW